MSPSDSGTSSCEHTSCSANTSPPTRTTATGTPSISTPSAPSSGTSASAQARTNCVVLISLPSSRALRLVVPEARQTAGRKACPRRRDTATAPGAPYAAFGPAPAAFSCDLLWPARGQFGLDRFGDAVAQFRDADLGDQLAEEAPDHQPPGLVLGDAAGHQVEQVVVFQPAAGAGVPVAAGRISTSPIHTVCARSPCSAPL